MRSAAFLVLTPVTLNLGFSVETHPPRTLHAAAVGLFTVGVGIHDRISERPHDWLLLTNQFSTGTPENCLKPNPVQVAEGRFNFALADAFVDFARSNKMEVVGHTLVWAKDDRTPPAVLPRRHEHRQPRAAPRAHEETHRHRRGPLPRSRRDVGRGERGAR